MYEPHEQWFCVQDTSETSVLPFPIQSLGRSPIRTFLELRAVLSKCGPTGLHCPATGVFTARGSPAKRQDVRVIRVMTHLQHSEGLPALEKEGTPVLQQPEALALDP